MCLESEEDLLDDVSCQDCGPGCGGGGGGPEGEAGDGIVWYCTILYYTLLYCTILYYSVLYRTVQVVEQQGGAGGGARWSKEQGGAEAIFWI